MTLKTTTTIGILLICLLTPQTGKAAHLKQDSLEQVISSTKSDTTRINTILKLCKQSDTYNESSFARASEAFVLSKAIGYKEGEINSQRCMGYMYYYSDQITKSIAHYSMALDIATNQNNKIQCYQLSETIGDIYFEQSNFEKSLQYHQQALSIAQEMKRKDLLIEPLNFIASGYFNQAQYDLSYKYYIQALDICEISNDKINAAIDLLNIGSIFFAQKSYSKALEYYNNSLKYNTATGQIEEQAKCLNNIGLVYENQKQIDLALIYYTKSYNLKIKSNDKTGIVNSLTNIANIYVQKNDYQNAIDNYTKALNLSESNNNKEGMARLQINIGSLYEKQNNYQDALIYISNGIDLAKQMNLNNYMRTGYEELSLINSKLGNYKQAYENHIIFSNINDTILNERQNKNLMDLQTKYDTDKKEKEIQLQNEKINRQAIIKNSFIVGCILLFMIALLLLNRYRIKKQSNDQLTVTNKKLEKSNKKISDQSKEIQQSISYAQRIQQTLLPDPQEIKSAFPNSFVLYKPKAVVSGDFYWFNQTQDANTIATIDCTGHGVPAAFMSVMAHNILFHMSKQGNANEPANILQTLHEDIRQSLKQDKSENSRDGMDASICKFDKDMKFLDYSGAMRPIYHIRNNQLTEYKSDKYSIGGFQSEETRKFSTQRIELQKDDCVYMFSDGYADQFGGKDQKKFMTKRLKDLLIYLSPLEIKEQEQILEMTFENWKNSTEQIDDVLVIGIKI